MKAYKIPEKPSTDIFNLPCVKYLRKTLDGKSFCYELDEYTDDEGYFVEILDNEGEYTYVVRPGDWLVFDEESRNWYVLTEKQYRKFKK